MISKTNLIIVLISTIFALCVGELILRITNKGPTIPDEYLSFRMRPSFDYDAQGFRNPKVLAQADIVAIGDSQTEGNNATREEAWPYILGGLANTSVYSMAVGGYSSIQYGHLVDTAIQLKPKVVLIGWYLGNDLLETERYTYQLPAWESLRDPEYVPEDEIGDKNAYDFRTILGSGVRPDSLSYHILRIRMWIRSQSLLYGLLGNATRSFREHIGVANTRTEKQDDIRSLSSDYPDLAYVYDTTKQFETVLSPSYRADAVDLGHLATAEGWRITKERYRFIKQRLSEAEIPLIIVIIPTKEKVYLEYMKSQNQEVPETFNKYDENESGLLEQIQKFCTEESLTCLSMLDTMRDAMIAGEDIYGETMDGHPRSPGYATIGKRVYSHLTEHSILTQ